MSAKNNVTGRSKIMYELKQQIHTFSGRVSTLNRIKPKQRASTIAKDEKSTTAGLLATHAPYFLKHIFSTRVNNLSLEG